MVAKDGGKRSVEQLHPSEQDAKEVMKFDASSCGQWSLQTDEKPSRFLSFHDNQVVTLGSASCNDVIISPRDSFLATPCHHTVDNWLHLVIIPLPTTGANCPSMRCFLNPLLVFKDQCINPSLLPKEKLICFQPRMQDNGCCVRWGEHSS
jgi:hypothetical protein